MKKWDNSPSTTRDKSFLAYWQHEFRAMFAWAKKTCLQFAMQGRNVDLAKNYEKNIKFRWKMNKLQELAPYAIMV